MVHNHVCNSLELQVGFLHRRKDISMTSFAIRYRAAMAPPTEMQLRRNLVGSTDPQKISEFLHEIMETSIRIGIVDYSMQNPLKFSWYFEKLSVTYFVWWLIAKRGDSKQNLSFRTMPLWAAANEIAPCPRRPGVILLIDKTRRSKLVQSRWHMFNWTG